VSVTRDASNIMQVRLEYRIARVSVPRIHRMQRASTHKIRRMKEWEWRAMLRMFPLITHTTHLRVAVWYSVLQCMVARRGATQCFPRHCCGALQCNAVCCSALQWHSASAAPVAVWRIVLQCVAVCCSVLQCVAVRCGIYAVIPLPLLQCVALCCSVL